MGQKRVMEVAPAASRDGRALQGSEPPVLLGETPGSAAKGGSQSKSPGAALGSPRGYQVPTPRGMKVPWDGGCGDRVPPSS